MCHHSKHLGQAALPEQRLQHHCPASDKLQQGLRWVQQASALLRLLSTASDPPAFPYNVGSLRAAWHRKGQLRRAALLEPAEYDLSSHLLQEPLDRQT